MISRRGGEWVCRREVVKLSLFTHRQVVVLDPNLLPPTKLRRMVFPSRTSSSHGTRKSGSVVYTPTRDVNIEQLKRVFVIHALIIQLSDNMAPPQAGAGVASTKRPRSRKSIAHMPSPDTVMTTDKENMTLDTSALAAKATSRLQKRSRSKSLGPGGIEALQEDSGNRGKVCHI